MKREVHVPEKLEDVWPLWERRPETLIYNGGTDFLVNVRRGKANPGTMICLERVAELKGVKDSGRNLFIGAGETHDQLIDNRLIVQHLPILVQSLKKLGSPPIRNMGTIGGNIATASPAGDTLPPLYCLNATVRLVSRDKTRDIPLSNFITGPGQTVLNGGELIQGVLVSKPEQGEIHYFEKVGRRNALAVAVVSMAARIKLSDEGMVESVQLAWGSVGPTVVVCPEVEKLMEGRILGMDVLDECATLVRKIVSPIDDVRASSEYRRQLAGNLLFRLVRFSPVFSGGDRHPCN